MGRALANSSARPVLRPTLIGYIVHNNSKPTFTKHAEYFHKFFDFDVNTKLRRYYETTYIISYLEAV